MVAEIPFCPWLTKTSDDPFGRIDRTFVFGSCIMPVQSRSRLHGSRWLLTTASRCLFLASASILSIGQATAQFGPGFLQNRVVGGVIVDAKGVVRNAEIADRQEMLQSMRQVVRGPQADFRQPTDQRWISLKELQRQITELKKEDRPIPEEMLFLGGLTRVEYVFVYPELNDIVIGGPAEPWTISEQGSVVGQRSGRPVLYLDDLLVALRTTEASKKEGISVSIDPTSEGIQRLQNLLKNVSLAPGQNPKQMEPAMRDAFGPQTVELKGVPADSHMARVLVAADYQMKRYGMDLAEAPVKNLPSYLEMIRNRPNAYQQSRWWMACDYDAIERSDDGLSWHLRGRGIKTLTEEEFVDAQGTRKQTGKQGSIAQKWADLFTEKLDELSVQDPIFGELRNVIDLCVVAALIDAKGLEQLAGFELRDLKDSRRSVDSASLGVPKQLPPQCSFVQTSGGWVVSTSGGVYVDAWTVVANEAVATELSRQRPKFPSTPAWCWNGT